MESPPNFSRNALATSKATTASAMTAAAGTAQVSDLSTLALKGFFVSISTERSGLYRVGIGFMAALRTIGSPFDMPPSMPPALLVFLENPGLLGQNRADLPFRE